MGAIALVEGAIAQRVFSAVDGLELPAQNAFDESLTVEHGGVVDLARRCAVAAEQGERVALVARAADLPAARNELASIAARRLGLVVHAVAEPSRGGVSSSMAGLAPALSLDDLLWAMLLGAGVSDAVDLALIARRAAEDSGCPFFIVHEGSHAHAIEPVSAPSRELCEAFVGRAAGRARRTSSPGDGDATGSAGDRAFAERVPFALSSAMRELETLTGRHHDVIERVPAGDAPVALVGVGALGDSLLADVDRLRTGGHDVAGVRVIAWRPFPAPRIVKALGRALAVTVLERVDLPLASGAPLAVQIKAAFADALTWAPDYPGVGRIPRIVSGVIAPEREVDSTDLDAIVHNVLADERGKRAFLLGGEGGNVLPAVTQATTEPSPAASMAGSFVMRGIASRRDVASAAAELCAAVLASALGLRTRVLVRDLGEDEGGGFAFDLVASRQRPRGTHVPHSIGLVALDHPALLTRGNALVRLAQAGVVAVPSDRRAAEALWAEVPSWVKAIVFDRGARVIGWSPWAGSERERDVREQDSVHTWVAASAFVGIALAAAATDRGLGLRAGSDAASIDGAIVQREVAEALRVGVAVHASEAALVADRGASAARAAFESIVEVPRATIEREDDGVRLGRRART